MKKAFFVVVLCLCLSVFSCSFAANYWDYCSGEEISVPIPVEFIKVENETAYGYKNFGTDDTIVVAFVPDDFSYLQSPDALDVFETEMYDFVEYMLPDLDFGGFVDYEFSGGLRKLSAYGYKNGEIEKCVFFAFSDNEAAIIVCSCQEKDTRFALDIRRGTIRE